MQNRHETIAKLGVVPAIVDLVDEGILISADLALRLGRWLAVQDVPANPSCSKRGSASSRKVDCTHVGVFFLEKTNQQADQNMMKTKKCASPTACC